MNVAQAGTHKFSVRFNKVNKTGAISTPGTNNYHNWKLYRNFAKVELEAGLQVMQYMVESQHINWDYISLSADSNAVVGISAPRTTKAFVLSAWFDPQGTSGSALLRVILPASGPADIVLTDLHSVMVPSGSGRGGIRILRVTKNGSGVSLRLFPSR